jgi:hypothetical protein
VESLVRYIIGILLLFLALCAAAHADGLFNVNGFYVGMTYGEYQAVVGKYSWSDPTLHVSKKYLHGTVPFRLAQVNIPEAPSWMKFNEENNLRFEGSQIDRAERIAFSVPPAGLDGAIQFLRSKYPNIGCGEVTFTDNSTEYRCVLRENNEEIFLSPKLGGGWLLTISSRSYSEHMAKLPRG